jgi:hypothetical protein
MAKTVEAVLERDGSIRLLEPMGVGSPRRALVTVLDEATRVALSTDDAHASARLAEPALAADWNRPEEDAAWSHLQSAP